MKRLGAALFPVALLLSGCAVGVPQPPTSPSLFGDSIVLNAKVASSIDGPTDYWFRYGERGDQANWSETPHQTIEVTEGEAEPVSAELTQLQASHRYAWQVCVADRGEDPPRVVCSTERKFGTVGDIVYGGQSTFSAVSGPDGENPGGTVGGQPVTCLRVESSEVAVIGTDQGVYHLRLVEGSGGFEIFHVEFVAWPNGSDHTNCPPLKEQPEGNSFDTRILIQDAP